MLLQNLHLLLVSLLQLLMLLMLLLLLSVVREMEEWMIAINAHIHAAFTSQYQIETDFWDEGNVATSFWMVPL